MTKVFGDYEKGNAVHSGETCPSVAQRMEVDRGIDFGASTRLGHRPQLMTFSPHGSAGLEEHGLAPRPLEANICEEGCPIIGQHDVSWRAGLADADRDGARI
jgi:hypothetical protein